jgi:hypothetical protein
VKTKYGWYFPLSREKLKTHWDQAVLTLDANVLLDLYRYHQDTREALIREIQKFEGRVWLSHQAADEFFRNRKKVIASTNRSFQEAQDNIEKLSDEASKQVAYLKNNRIIPDEVADTVREEINAALLGATNKIDEAKGQYPNFLREDTLLHQLSEIFDGAIGEPFDKNQYEEALKEGKRRVEAELPPGFLDKDKAGDKPYGDYFMWRQILDYAANAKKPIIFVTSEGKADWWEKASGITTGLHYELLKEAAECTGQPFIAFRTDRFFEYAADMSGEESNKNAADEISALVKSRSSDPLVQRLGIKNSEATDRSNSGILSIELLRPSYNFTCSGYFKPNLVKVPTIHVELFHHPDEMPEHRLNWGTGTNFDFNVHLKSTDYGVPLPPGIYDFVYGAVAGADDDGDESS